MPKAKMQSVLEDEDLLKIENAFAAGSPALEALKLVYGQRNSDYGPVENNFIQIAEIMNVIKDRTDTNIYTPQRIVTMMMALKLARISFNPTEDSFADLIGYTDIKGRLVRKKIG